MTASEFEYTYSDIEYYFDNLASQCPMSTKIKRKHEKYFLFFFILYIDDVQCLATMPTMNAA